MLGSGKPRSRLRRRRGHGVPTATPVAQLLPERHGHGVPSAIPGAQLLGVPFPSRTCWLSVMGTVRPPQPGAQLLPEQDGHGVPDTAWRALRCGSEIADCAQSEAVGCAKNL